MYIIKSKQVTPFSKILKNMLCIVPLNLILPYHLQHSVKEVDRIGTLNKYQRVFISIEFTLDHNYMFMNEYGVSNLHYLIKSPLPFLIEFPFHVFYNIFFACPTIFFSLIICLFTSKEFSHISITSKEIWNVVAEHTLQMMRYADMSKINIHL